MINQLEAYPISFLVAQQGGGEIPPGLSSLLQPRLR